MSTLPVPPEEERADGHEGVPQGLKPAFFFCPEMSGLKPGSNPRSNNKGNSRKQKAETTTRAKATATAESKQPTEQ
jgi:hypothetical protein